MNFRDGTTFIGTIADPQRARAQMTGVGATLKQSECSGRMRAQRVIDGAPDTQLKHAIGYPAPEPRMDPKGKLIDRVTGKPWKMGEAGPHF